MPKRGAQNEDGERGLKDGERPAAMDADPATDAGMGEFEDEFEDEFDSADEEIFEAGADGRPDAETEGEAMDVDTGTFIVGRTKLPAGQTLSPDMSTYEMLHSLATPWPCLSFDILRDSLGDTRTVYPATMYSVAGTQADSAHAEDNQILVLKFSGLGRTERGMDSDDDSDDDDLEDADPILESRTIPIPSTVNRIRAWQTTPEGSSNAKQTFTATMTEDSQVHIHDITPHFESFDAPGTTITSVQNKPQHTIRTHRTEGYAVDWSPLVSTGKLLTGDNNGAIHMTSLADGRWVTDSRPFSGHRSSVEEVQWSPSEDKVFASASSDGTVRVWDIRSKSRKAALSIQISDVDVNVMSWSRKTTHLLATGADDGVWAVWDLRQWKPTSGGGGSSARQTPIASFAYHKEQITSVEWHPTDDSIVAVAAGDNTVTLWDLAVELDDEESKDTGGVSDVPPQLLFVHYMDQAKEVHWHPQIPGTLAATGSQFSVFKTISV